MFCTSKEQETCNVEKRGCEGCYYNKDGDYVNEEEMTKILTDEDMYWNYPEKQVLKATKNLLNLYIQEKEKNKKLEKEIIELRMAQLPDTSEIYKELKKIS